MGPVHIDFPMDLQRKQDLVVLKSAVSNDRSKINPRNENENKFATELFAALLRSNKPLVYIGNGCRDENTLEKIKNIFTKHKIPYILSWSAIDLFPESDPQNIGRVGIYGDRAANLLLQQSDLLIVLGSRLAIPQTGYNKSDFARNATKWVIEIDDTECDKFLDLDWNVLNADVGVFLSELLNLADWQNTELQDFSSWWEVIEATWRSLPRLKQVGPIDEPSSGYVHSASVIDVLNSALDSDAIISTDVGAALLTGHNMFEKKGTQRFFTSQGLGEMGFGLPAAIGAYFAKPIKQNVCLNTDGAMMFNLQELQVVKEYKIPLKLFVFNNSGYTMIKISQDNLFDSRIAGSSTDTGISFPNFSHVAMTFGMEHILINSNTDLLQNIQKGLESDNAVLIEVVMNPEQKYLPRLATKKLTDGTLVSPPLEDLDPKISITELEKFLGYKPFETSIKSRES
jgi:acetolactate synthase-1/2/3 large subunit